MCNPKRFILKYTCEPNCSEWYFSLLQDVISEIEQRNTTLHLNNNLTV